MHQDWLNFRKTTQKRSEDLAQVHYKEALSIEKEELVQPRTENPAIVVTKKARER